MSDEAQALANALHTWTEQQKHDANLVRNLCRRIEQEVIALIPTLPVDWNSHELRQLLYERFQYETTSTMKDKRSARYRNFRNFCLINNL